MKKLILASASPRRKDFLNMLGLDFEIKPSAIEEKLNPRLKPRKQVEVLSKEKALFVAAGENDAIVIGADSMVHVDNELMGKPKDAQDAMRMLKKLSGKAHSVVTGLTIIDVKAKKVVTKSIETRVTFRRMTPQEIKTYVKKHKPFDKAGAYALQGPASIFVEKLEGDYAGAVGLPIFTLAKELKKVGISVL